MKWITHLEGGPKRVNHAAVAVDHKIYSFGGYCTGDNSKKYTSMDVHVLNTTTFRWTKHPVSDLPYFENDDILPFKRYGHTAVVYGDKVYIWGGRNNMTSCSTLFCFDTVWHCWTAPKTTGNIPLARDGHAACVWKNYMFIFGGYEEDSESFAKSMYMLDLDKMHWSFVCPKGPTPPVGDFQTAVVIKNKMYVFGGRGNASSPSLDEPDEETYSNDLWCFDLQQFEWQNTMATGDVPLGRRSHSAFVYNDKMYIFGGYNSLKEQHFNDVIVYDPVTNCWKEVITNGKKPCERRRQACVLVGDRIFLFGGTSPQEQVNDYEEDYDNKLIDYSDLFVLDMKPSLKTLCLIAVKAYKLDDSSLPHNLKMDLQNMFLPNRIKSDRTINSAG